MPLSILNIAGTRPNFMKIAALQREMDRHPDAIGYKLVHTGQHYDHNMSQAFFDDLGIRPPEFRLDCGSGQHGEQTGRIMIAFEKVLLAERPDLVLVVGDVNSTIAAALVATKHHIRVAHVEAGSRSFDRRMPEEINRVLTDAIADHLFAIDEAAVENLRREGIPENRIHLVGDIMADLLLETVRRVEGDNGMIERLGLVRGRYAVATLHRPSNVDEPVRLARLMTILAEIAAETPVIFPIHPRTRQRIADAGLAPLVEKTPGLQLIDPLGYLEFVSLFGKSQFVITDSGSLQLETTVLDIPCLTARDTTERLNTISDGTNYLVGDDVEAIRSAVAEIRAGRGKHAGTRPLWDGHAAERIVQILRET